MLGLNAMERTVLNLLGVLLLGLLVYWPGLSGGYVLDDFANLVDNPDFAAHALHSQFWAAVWSSGSSQLHRPLSMLSFAVQMWFSGMDPWPLKLANILIHLFNGLLVFLLSLRVLAWLNQAASRRWLLAPRTIALLVMAAWILAPIQLTAVLYVVQRMESIAALFVLLGLLAWWHGRMLLIQGRTNAWWWIIGGLVGGTVLATLSKETGVLLPAYAFLLDWLVLGFAGRANTPDRRLWAMFALVLFLPALLGLAWLLPGILSGHAYDGRDFDLAERLWTEGRVLVDYLHWIVAPIPNDLTLYHDDVPFSTGWLQPWTTAASWALIAVLLGSAWFLRRRVPLYALGVAWFFAGQSLVSTILPLELVYEHRNYLPSLGVFLALFGLLSVWAPDEPERRRSLRLILMVAGLALIALYAGFTTMRAHVWGNPFRLAYFESTTHPQSPRASYDLGRLLMVTSSTVDSPRYQLGQQVMKKAASLPNAGLQPLQALIFMSAKNRQPVKPQWWQDMRNRIVRRPISAEDVSALFSLVQCGISGTCRYQAEDERQLHATLVAAVKRYPRRAVLVTLEANFEANIEHDYAQAYRLMLRAVVLAPNKFQYWKNLMVVQLALGRLDEAANVLKRLRELNSLDTENAEIAALAEQLAQKKGGGKKSPAGAAS